MSEFFYRENKAGLEELCWNKTVFSFLWILQPLFESIESAVIRSGSTLSYKFEVTNIYCTTKMS